MAPEIEIILLNVGKSAANGLRYGFSGSLIGIGPLSGSSSESKSCSQFLFDCLDLIFKAFSPNKIPPSTCAATPSGLTAIPQSIAAVRMGNSIRLCMTGLCFGGGYSTRGERLS